MADVVTSQVIENGPRWIVMAFTNLSDGTGESNVVKVNEADFGVVVAGQTYLPGKYMKIHDVWYSVNGMSLSIGWGTSSDPPSQAALILAGTDHQHFGIFGGIPNPGLTTLGAATGNIVFSTIGAAANDSYTVILRLSKGVPQF